MRPIPVLHWGWWVVFQHDRLSWAPPSWILNSIPDWLRFVAAILDLENNRVYCSRNNSLFLSRLLIGYGPYKPGIVVNCFVVYHQLFLTFIASKNLKHFLYSNYVLKRANDFKIISNWLVLLSRCVRNLKPFHVNKNRSWSPQTHTRNIINILLTSFSRSVL